MSDDKSGSKSAEVDALFASDGDSSSDSEDAEAKAALKKQKQAKQAQGEAYYNQPTLSNRITLLLI